MITEMDEVKCQNAFQMIDSSTLESRTKSDLKETIEEAKLNLNGRTLEERCESIARNQFDTTRFLAEIIIQFKKVSENIHQPKNWKDVLVESKWAIVTLGSIISISTIFQPQLIHLLECVAKLF